MSAENEVKSDVPPGEQRTPEYHELVQHLKDLDAPISLEKLTEILGITIKHDDNTKAVTFLAMLLTYTEKDQVNIGFLAESSTGKSYIPLEIVRLYFPQEDIVKLGHVSPKALFHDNDPKITVWQLDPTDDRDIPDEKKRHIRHINLERKIVLFIDQPHDQILQNLRSFMSHDDKHLDYKTADKTGGGQIRTKTAVLDGFATVIYCSAGTSLMQDQEKTRLLILSPEVTFDKIWDSVAYAIERKCNSKAHEQFLKENPDIALLANRVWTIKRAHINSVKIPDELKNMINDHFKEKREKHTNPRYMRDINRLIGIINAWALFNFHQRKREGDDIIATEEDVLQGFKLYESIGEANEYGLSPEVYDIFKQLEPFIQETETQGITKTQFQNWYYRTFFRSVGEKRASNLLKLLDEAGLLSEELDPNNRSRHVYMLMDRTEVKRLEGGVTQLQTYDEIKGIDGYSSENSIPPPLGAGLKHSLREVCEVLRGKLPGSFQDADAYAVIERERPCGLNEAVKIFEVLIKNGEVFHDTEGLWRWI